MACLILIGCDNSTSTEEPDPQITDALILLEGSDDEATIEAGETVKFTGYALTESGDQIPLNDLSDDWSWEWESTNSDVFTVDAEGNGTGEAEGDAFCVISLFRLEEGTDNAVFKQGDVSEMANTSPRLPEINRIFVGRDSLLVGIRLN
ncbi:Ig-like domain-containing protein [Fodinibius salsisoli]|uniref:Ig-like domain-containing protein n=1 Tax=Fodinibius salsisoli TaxID=2820877 RepID=A0ABT3PJL1_9BACT|nr:Ig-like domain-containing protein [Fodinibius salsisoli]MCW9706131.1 Ig-like domain-containing protein [Fodinibius salsisoli]